MPFGTNSHNTDNSGNCNTRASNDETVPPEDRREKVLAFIHEHDMALPPLAIFAGLKRQYDITFSYRTVQNALSDLLDDGYVIRVDTKPLREDGRIESVDDSGSGKRSYYFITDRGIDRLNE